MRPEEETGRIGPHKSTNTLSSGWLAFSPSLTFGTEDRVCLLRMHASHFAGEEERSIVTPNAPFFRAMSTTAPLLQCPRWRCHISMLGVCFAWKASEGRVPRGASTVRVVSLRLCMVLTFDRDRL